MYCQSKFPPYIISFPMDLNHCISPDLRGDAATLKNINHLSQVHHLQNKAGGANPSAMSLQQQLEVAKNKERVLQNRVSAKEKKDRENQELNIQTLRLFQLTQMRSPNGYFPS